MSSFATKHPFFILMLCLIIAVVGVTTVARMPVDLLPGIKIPLVVVATFYSGMPPQQIEGDITDIRCKRESSPGLLLVVPRGEQRHSC